MVTTTRMVLVVMSAIFISGVSYGSDSSVDIQGKIYDNASDQYTTCAAFYTVSSVALERSGKKDLSNHYSKASDTALQYGLLLASETRKTDIAKKVTLARYEMSLKEMIIEIDKDISNISILMNKHGYICKEAMDDFEAYMKKLIEKEMH